MAKTKTTQPRKKRKRRANAPLHVKRKYLNSLLSQKLREKYNRRRVPLRTGDTVKIMRGEFSGIRGEVTGVDLHKVKVYVDGVNIAKTDGTEVPKALDPSNLMITDLDLEDSKRVQMLEKKMNEEE